MEQYTREQQIQSEQQLAIYKNVVENLLALIESLETRYNRKELTLRDAIETLALARTTAEVTLSPALFTIEINGKRVYSDADYHRANARYDSLKMQTSGKIVFKFDGGEMARRPALD